MALYVSDSYVHGQGFHALGFELFDRMLGAGLEPVDIVSVVRHNKTLEMGNYRKAAEEENFFLRGFNYLFIMKRPEAVRDDIAEARLRCRHRKHVHDQHHVPRPFGTREGIEIGDVHLGIAHHHGTAEMVGHQASPSSATVQSSRASN